MMTNFTADIAAGLLWSELSLPYLSLSNSYPPLNRLWLPSRYPAWAFTVWMRASYSDRVLPGG